MFEALFVRVKEVLLISNIGHCYTYARDVYVYIYFFVCLLYVPSQQLLFISYICLCFFFSLLVVLIFENLFFDN